MLFLKSLLFAKERQIKLNIVIHFVFPLMKLQSFFY